MSVLFIGNDGVPRDEAGLPILWDDILEMHRQVTAYLASSSRDENLAAYKADLKARYPSMYRQMFTDDI